MTNPIQELDLQRCVDGELPLAQRRIFLEQLDQSEGGWKSLALAFLESQDFTSASAEFRNGSAATPTAMTSARHGGGPQFMSSVARYAAMAASVAAAFWLGSRSSGRPDVELARDAVSNGVPAMSRQQGTGRAQPTFSPDATDDSVSLASLGGPMGPRPTAVLKLPFTGSGDEEFEIPVYDQRNLASDEGPEIPLVWPTSNQSTALSPPGYRVKSEKNLLSIPLSTGDTVYVPVEVSNVTYAVQ